MRMNKREQREIEETVLGITHDERFTAKFYMHEIEDPDNPTIKSAMEKIQAKADRMTAMTGKQKDPDLTPENLIRNGAESRKIRVPYVEIKRVGSNGSKSHRVTDEHKQTFPQEWAEFEAKNHEELNRRTIRAQRENVPAFASGCENQTQSFGGFSYEFNI